MLLLLFLLMSDSESVETPDYTYGVPSAQPSLTVSVPASQPSYTYGAT